MNVEERKRQIESIKALGKQLIDEADTIECLIVARTSVDPEKDDIYTYMHGDIHHKIGLCKCLQMDIEDSYERIWYPDI